MSQEISAGDGITTSVANWSFDGGIAQSFDDHVSKSVPFYQQLIDLICIISDFFIANESRYLDIGCSTGTLSRSIARRHSTKSISVLGVDSVHEMIVEAKSRTGNQETNGEKASSNIEFLCADILDIMPAVDSYDMISSVYTIQFIRPRYRQELINNIYSSLSWGGAFIWAEKVRGADARFENILEHCNTLFKSKNYSLSEIAAKKLSLVGVLEPFSSNGNMDLLHRAGFKDVMVVFRMHCFECYLAIK